jgi:hypothetical protein
LLTGSANAILAGVLGRALHLHPRVKLHGFVAMSNHLDLIATAPASELARFLAHLNGNIARRINRHRRRTGPFWHRRSSVEPILDPDAELDRLTYLHCNPAQANLTARATEWPGVSTLHEATGGNVRTATWFDVDGFLTALRQGARPNPKDYEHHYPLTLHPLPGLAHLTPQERADRVRAAVAAREAEVAARHAEHGTRPAGAHAVLRQPPGKAPRHTKRSPRPLCHTRCLATWKAYAATYRAFKNAYREASTRYRQGELEAAFPENSHRPPVPPAPS